MAKRKGHVSQDEYRRLLISGGIGVALPAVGALEEALVAIGREGDEARRMIENGVFCDELGRSFLVFPDDQFAWEMLIKAAGRVVNKARAFPDQMPAVDKAVGRIYETLVTIVAKPPAQLLKRRIMPRNNEDLAFYYHPCLPVRRIKDSVVPHGGSVFGDEKLRPIFNEINRHAFRGALPGRRIELSWVDAGAGFFGQTEPAKGVIRISRDLDGFPLGFLWFVMYHEMLHIVCPGPPSHSSDFCAKEALFPRHREWREAETWASIRAALQKIEFAKLDLVDERPPATEFMFEGLRQTVIGWSFTFSAWVARDEKGSLAMFTPGAIMNALRGRHTVAAANPRRKTDDVMRIVVRSLLTGEPLRPLAKELDGKAVRNPSHGPCPCVAKDR